MATPSVRSGVAHPSAHRRSKLVGPYVADRLRLLLTAIGVLLVLVSLAWVSAVWIPKPYGEYVFGKWMRFAVVTISAIAYLIRAYWHARKHIAVWLLFVPLLLIHVVGLGYFFYTGPGLSLVTFGPTVGFECGLFMVAAYRIVGVGPRLPKHREKGLQANQPGL